MLPNHIHTTEDNHKFVILSLRGAVGTKILTALHVQLLYVDQELVHAEALGQSV